MSMSFAAIWVTILVCTGIKKGFAIRKLILEKKDKETVGPSELSIVPNSVDGHEQLATKLREYLIAFVPSLYTNNKKVEIWRQILCDHKLFRVFFNSNDVQNAWKDSLHILTLISANMFILAVLFDARYPTVLINHYTITKLTYDYNKIG